VCSNNPEGCLSLGDGTFKANHSTPMTGAIVWKITTISDSTQVPSTTGGGPPYQLLVKSHVDHKLYLECTFTTSVTVATRPNGETQVRVCVCYTVYVCKGIKSIYIYALCYTYIYIYTHTQIAVENKFENYEFGDALARQFQCSCSDDAQQDYVISAFRSYVDGAGQDWHLKMVKEVRVCMCMCMCVL
jgi:hypothetical protein